MSPVSEIVVAVDWIVANHVKPAVINLSIQLIHFHAERLAAEEIQVSEMLDQSISKALATGIPVVSAAGNSNVNACNLPPSKIPGVIAVAASDYKDNRASFSNHGPCISLFAPGVDILSVNARGGYAYGSGTSQAAPFVAGAVALYLETHSRASPAEIMQVLKGSAVSGVIKNPKDIPNLLLQTSFKNMTTTLQSFETYREQSKMWIVIGGSVVGVVAVGIFVLALVRSRDRQTTQANPRV
jgi:subtilisin family serine protease